MCCLGNIAMREYQESVTTGQTHRQMLDKVIPMCRYALQATQKLDRSVKSKELLLTNSQLKKWHVQ